MKRIFIVRHAKSDWNSSAEKQDIDRPLNTRGVKNAYIMSNMLKENGVLPNAMLASNGIRALHTAIIFAHQIGFDTKKMIIIPELYHAEPKVILEELSKLSEDITEVMLFAHNPGIADFASFVHKEKYINVPTCTILEMETSAEVWKKLDFDNMKIVSIESPKQ